MTPRETVRETLIACLPEGVPPSFVSINEVAAIGRGPGREITASLTMIDGLPATVRLRPWAHGWSHQYTDLPGGALSWEGRAWVRFPDAPEAGGEPLREPHSRQRTAPNLPAPPTLQAVEGQD